MPIYMSITRIKPRFRVPVMFYVMKFNGSKVTTTHGLN
jgi:hypothetical protein